MNISCTNNCIHQQDGACTLTEIPNSFTSSAQALTDGQNETDCLYCETMA